MATKALNEITIMDVTDGYSVILTSEAYTFVGGTSGVAAGYSCSTNVVAFCGTSQCSTVTVTAADIVCPTGISASVANSGTASPTVTFTTTATVSESCEATIPVVVDGITVNKKFSFAVALSGADGTSVSINSAAVTYQASSSGTTAPTGTWSSSVPTVSSGQYLWTRTVVTYSDSTTTTSYSVSYKAADGSDGTSVTVRSTEVTYQASSSGTTAPTGTWSSSVPFVSKGQFLWTRTVVTYSDSATTTSYSVSYIGTDGSDGADGTDGADAVTLIITSSNGTIFKNSSGSTVLTAQVFVGAAEQTITDAGVCGSLGSIKWYKGNSTTAMTTAKSITVSAADVDNTQTYTAQLE